MGLSKFLVAKGDFAHHSRKRLNAYNWWVMLFVSIGSLCYGYTANVISATLGKFSNAFSKDIGSEEILIRYLAQPTFISYMHLDPTVYPNAHGLELLSATNGVFQTGGVIGTLTLYVRDELLRTFWNSALMSSQVILQ